MEVNELIRQAAISRAKSEQAIQRSKRLVKGTKNLLKLLMDSAAQPTGNAQDVPKPMEIVRQESRKIRENSRRVLEESKAARNRCLEFHNRLCATPIGTKRPEGKTA